MSMAERVVDELESIEVEEQDRDRELAFRPSLEQLLEVSFHKAAVRQPGERVVHRLITKTRLGPLDVVKRSHYLQRGEPTEEENDAEETDPVD